MQVATAGHPRTGTVSWHGQLLDIVKVPSEETAQALWVTEHHGHRGAAGPMHIHSKESETWYLLEGAMTWWRGDQRFEAQPGDCIHLPTGVPHSYRIDSEFGRWLCIGQPGSMDHFFLDAGVPATSLTPPPAGNSFDPAKIREVAGTFGVQVVGPPPGPDA